MNEEFKRFYDHALLGDIGSLEHLIVEAQRKQDGLSRVEILELFRESEKMSERWDKSLRQLQKLYTDADLGVGAGNTERDILNRALASVGKFDDTARNCIWQLVTLHQSDWNVVLRDRDGRWVTANRPTLVRNYQGRSIPTQLPDLLNGGSHPMLIFVLPVYGVQAFWTRRAVRLVLEEFLADIVTHNDHMLDLDEDEINIISTALELSRQIREEDANNKHKRFKKLRKRITRRHDRNDPLGAAYFVTTLEPAVGLQKALHINKWCYRKIKELMFPYLIGQKT